MKMFQWCWGLAAAFSVHFVAPSVAGELLYNNGGMVTHAGLGVGGADVSMASLDVNTAGSNARVSVPNPWFRIADDFSVGGDLVLGWNVSTIVTHAYETNSATPTWTGGNLNIWSGRPGDESSVILASIGEIASVQFTNIYRTFNGAGNVSNVARPIHSLTWDVTAALGADLFLEAGSYWIDWQVEGGASGWAPYAMEANPDNLNEPVTLVSNGRQMTSFEGAPLWQGLAGVGAETPFFVTGSIVAVPEPGSVAGVVVMGAVLGAGVYRRRRRAIKA
jgi:hypothetical protein